MAVALVTPRGVDGSLLFNAGPGQVHVEEKEKNAKTNYGWL